LRQVTTTSTCAAWDWRELERILAVERDVVRQLMAAPNAGESREELCSETLDAPTHAADLLDGVLYGLEPGAVAAVLALSAMGAIPYWNDGGGIHSGPGSNARPIARFFAKPAHVPLLPGSRRSGKGRRRALSWAMRCLCGSGRPQPP
jgi:hypothetical protein